MENWLNCTVSDGMFPGEKAVKIQSHNQFVSFFLSDDTDIIRVHEKNKQLRVTVLDYDSEYALVSLPKETIEGSNIVKVYRMDLSHDPIQH